MHFNEKQKVQSSSDEDEQSGLQSKTGSTMISEHLDQYNQISATQGITQEKDPLQILLEHENISWDNNFESTIKVSILETDIESYHLHLHYGNFKMKLNVLMTNLDRGFYQRPQLGRGSFGTIYELVSQSEVMKICVIKRIELKFRQYEINLKEIYKEYFLSFLASALKIGSKVLSPFGYDIIITKNSAFFVMQKCQSFHMEQLDQMKCSIAANLKYLHKLNLVHLDIKPQNIMYSRTFNKYVFIDFGLSLINSEAIGFKTKTSFLGTLKYCSDEMKKLYMIRNSGYVDLYHNDAVALHKSLKDLEVIFISLNRNYVHNQVESLQQYELARRYTSQSIPVFRLKYCLFKNEIDNSVFQMNKIRHLKKTLVSILGNRQKQQKLEQVLGETYSQICKSLFDGKYQFNFFDEMMSYEFKDLHFDLVSSYRFKFESLLQLNDQRFEKILLNQKSVYEIFLYFDPFYCHKINKASSLKGYTKYKDNLDQYRLIEKIYKALKQQETPLKSKKVHQVIKFLYKKLKSFYTPALLESFKILFMIIQDWVSQQSVEFQILSMINDPILKMLKICSSIMYWNAMWESSYIKDCKILTAHAQKINLFSVSLSQQQLHYVLFIKQLLISTLKSQNIADLNTNIRQLFIQISTSSVGRSVLERSEYIEEVQNINSLCGSNIIKQRKTYDENVWINLLKLQLESNFYSKTQAKYQLRSKSAFGYLVSIKKQLQQLTIDNCDNSTIKLLISYFFETFSYRNDLVSLTASQYLYRVLSKGSSQNLEYFNQRYIQNFEIVFYDKKHNSLVDSNYIYIHFSSGLIPFLKCWYAKQKAFELAARIQSIFEKFSQHKMVRKIIDSNYCCLFAYRLCIGYFCLLQLKNQKKDVRNELYNRIKDAGQILTLMKGCPGILEGTFISIVFEAVELFEQNGKSQIRFVQIFIKYCRNYFQILDTFKFKKTVPIFLKFIHTLQANQLYQQSFNLINGLAYYTYHISTFSLLILPAFLEAVGIFTKTTPKPSLFIIYQKNRFQKQEMINGNLAYLIFLMFHQVFSLVQAKQRQRQLKRSVLSSRKMKKYALICLNSVVYDILLTEDRLIHKRKLYIIKKLECRHTQFNQNPNTDFTDLIVGKIWLMKKKLIEKALLRKVQKVKYLLV